MTLADSIQQTVDILNRSERLVVLTGAGVSKESGVPTFRDALDGLWARYDPQQLATAQAFRSNPALVWQWYEYRRGLVRGARPNPGHHALAELESLLPQVVVVTQNVDDLHQRAGSTDIVPLHGAIMRNKCFADCQGSPTVIDITAIPAGEGDDPPRCPHCGAFVRPDVVWFGESLPLAALDRAQQRAQEADVMLVVGTSGVVQPAASLPFIARRFGATIIEVNPRRSEITPISEVWLDAPSGEALPQVVAAIRARRSGGEG